MIAQRLGHYLKHKGITIYAIEVKIGASKGSISKAIKNNKNIGSNVLENILTTYKDLNPYWLMMGEGDMILSPSEYTMREIKNLDVSGSKVIPEYMKLHIINNISTNENDWFKVPEFKKLIKSLSLSIEMKEIRSDIQELREQLKTHLESFKQNQD